MSFEAVKSNATWMAQKFANIAAQTATGITTAATGTVNGVKNVASPVAHGALNITAETADLLSKSALILCPVAAGVFMLDSVMFADHILNPIRRTWFFNPCGENVPFLGSFRGELQEGYFGSENVKSTQCIGALNQGQLKAMNSWQGLAGVALLTATPIAALTFRKINQLAIKLNSSF